MRERGAILAAAVFTVVLIIGALIGGLDDVPAHATVPSTLTTVVVDTDMSWDDITALVYLLRQPGIDIKAITVSGTGLTHCRPGVNHVRQLVANLGHHPVPVACGRQEPVQGSLAFPAAWRQSADSFFGLDLPAVPTPRSQETATEVLDRALSSSPKSVVVNLGPMTNLAEALKAHPHLRERIERVYAMGGAFGVPGNEIVHGQAEYNVYVDATAAAVVLRSGVPVTLVPLDACDDVPVTVLFRDALAVQERPGASEVVSMLLTGPYYYMGSQYFWDPLAAMVATYPGVHAQMSDERVVIDQSTGAGHGRTLRSAGGAPVQVVMNVDAQAFYQQYLRVVTADHALKFTTPTSRLDISYEGGRWSVRNAVRPTIAPIALRVTNLSSSLIGVLVGQVSPGHTVREVDAAIRANLKSVPAWFRVVIQVTVPSAHPATWGVDLRPGRYVVVGGGASQPLQRLAAWRVA